jgi:hypothetical protein
MPDQIGAGGRQGLDFRRLEGVEIADDGRRVEPEGEAVAAAPVRGKEKIVGPDRGPIHLCVRPRAPGDDDRAHENPSARPGRGWDEPMSIPSAGITRIRFYGSRASALLSARLSGLPVLNVHSRVYAAGRAPSRRWLVSRCPHEVG